MPVLGELPDDPDAAEIAGGRPGRASRLSRSMLVMSAHRLAGILSSEDPLSGRSPTQSIEGLRAPFSPTPQRRLPVRRTRRIGVSRVGPSGRSTARRWVEWSADPSTVRQATAGCHPTRGGRGAPVRDIIASAIRERVAEDLASPDGAALTGDDRREYARRQVFAHLDMLTAQARRGGTGPEVGATTWRTRTNSAWHKGCSMPCSGWGSCSR